MFRIVIPTLECAADDDEVAIKTSNSKLLHRVVAAERFYGLPMIASTLFLLQKKEQKMQK